MLVLALDASTYAGSVALIRGNAVLGESSVAMRGQNEERLMPAVADLLEHHGVLVGEVEAVACGAGPGSFTSLRIAASIAKGLAVASGVPLLAAPSTLLVLSGAQPALPPGSYIVALDAMRGDFFCRAVVVDASLNLTPGRAWRATRSDLEAHASTSGATIVGPAEPLALEPRAGGFAKLIEQGIALPVDVAAWEPDYGRKAEAQVRWEAAHGMELTGGSGVGGRGSRNPSLGPRALILVPTISIRAARDHDLDDVAAIERAVFNDPWSRRSFAELVHAPQVLFFVAASETGVIGYAVVLLAGVESELANLAVARLTQRQGLGRRLLEAGLRAARDRGCGEMFLEVRASNAAAMTLYASAGFESVGRRVRYYARPVEDAVVMRAALANARASSLEPRA